MFDFESNQEVADINAVPTNLRVFYTRADESAPYTLRDDEITRAAISNLSQQGKALQSERGITAELRKKGTVDLTPLKDFGESPEDIAAAVKAKIDEARSQGNADVKTNLDKVRGEMTTAFDGERQKWATREKALTGQLYKLLVSNEIAKAVGKDANPEVVEKLSRDEIKVVEQDGELRVVVVDAAGDIRHNGVGSPMSVSELVKDMKGNPKYAGVFASDTRNGGGTPPGSGRQALPTKGTEEKSSIGKIGSGLKRHYGQLGRPVGR